MSIPECDRLDDYLLDGLSAEEASAFEAHLSGCSTCRDELEHQRRIDRLLAQGTGRFEAVPRWLIGRIEGRIHRSARRRVVRMACGLSAAALAVSALGVWLTIGGLGTGNNRQPLVHERAEPGEDGNRVDPPGGPTPRPQPVASVSIADPSAAILVPVETKQPNVSIVWIYPTVGPVKAPGID